jgi:hypothetical protein
LSLTQRSKSVRQTTLPACNTGSTRSAARSFSTPDAVLTRAKNTTAFRLRCKLHSKKWYFYLYIFTFIITAPWYKRLCHGAFFYVPKVDGMSANLMSSPYLRRFHTKLVYCKQLFPEKNHTKLHSGNIDWLQVRRTCNRYLLRTRVLKYIY